MTSLNDLETFTLGREIVKGSALSNTTNKLLDNFANGEEKNAKLIKKFFNQAYFSDHEGLINKLIEIKSDITFNDIKEESINLALLTDREVLRKFKDIINKPYFTDEIKKAFVCLIRDVIKNQIGTLAPYNDFDNKCPTSTGNPPVHQTNIIGYLYNIISYLDDRQNQKNGKTTTDILKHCDILNQALNSQLHNKIPDNISLSDSSINMDIKNTFDALLSFEIGEKANRVIRITDKITNQYVNLFSNTLPGINTLLVYSDYKFDPSKFGAPYQDELEQITNDTTKNASEKNSAIQTLQRKYYLDYVKSQNKSLGEALSSLYDVDFDYSKIVDNGFLKKYLSEVAKLNIKHLYDEGMLSVLKFHLGDIDDFLEFYKKLADPDEDKIVLDNSRSPAIELKVKKNILEGKNFWLKDLNNYGDNPKPYDTLPISVKIPKTEIDQLPISMNDKIMLLNYLAECATKQKKSDSAESTEEDIKYYTFQGNDIGKLLYLFFVINSHHKLSNINPDDLKQIDSILGIAKDRPKEELEENGDGEKTEEDLKSNVDDINNFILNIKSFGREGTDFSDGSEIRIQRNDSDLPGGGKKWIKIKVSNINMNRGTFTGKIYGGELGLDTVEGASKTFFMNSSSLKMINDLSGGSNNIALLPPPNESDFCQYCKKIQGNHGKLSISFPPQGVTIESSDFKHTVKNGEQEKVEKIQYWGNNDGSNGVCSYKIKYNPSKKVFHITSYFIGEGEEEDKKTHKKEKVAQKFYYEKDMDRNSFLIFMSEKKLHPQTKDEANNAHQQNSKEMNNKFAQSNGKIQNGYRLKLNWFNITCVKGGIKHLFELVNSKIKDYNKREQEKLEDIIAGDWGIFNKMANVAKFIPRKGLQEGLYEAQYDYYNKADSRTWSHIERYLNIFKADPQFSDTFENLPPHEEARYGKSLRNQVIDRVKNTSGLLEGEDRYKAAALLLANLQSGNSPYRGLSDQENSGLRVKALLGRDHYQLFLKDKRKCIEDMKKAYKEGKKIEKYQDTLAKCEMDYISNNIKGANGKAEYFGSKESRGEGGTNNYIPNPAKRILSEKFAKELDTAYKGWFTDSSVEEAYGKINHNDFYLAKEDFFRLIKSSRHQQAFANLKKMFQLAKENDQILEYKKCFIFLMLSGVLDVYGSKKLRSLVYGRGKSTGFLPGMVAKENNSAEYVAKLLDYCTEGDFTKSVNSYFKEGRLYNGAIRIEKLMEDLNGDKKKNKKAWLTNEKMEMIDKKFKDFRSETFPSKTPLSKIQEIALDPSFETQDTSLYGNAKCINDAGLSTNSNVVADRMEISDGEFKGKDGDEKDDKASFWKQVQKEIKDIDPHNPSSVKFMLNQYFNRFGKKSNSEKREIYNWVYTAQEFKQKLLGKENIRKYNRDYTINLGYITNREIDSVIWYAFMGTIWNDCFNARKLPPELYDTLNTFQSKIKEAFKHGTLFTDLVKKEVFHCDGHECPFILGSRHEYDKAVGKENEFVFGDEGDEGDIGSSDIEKDKKARKKILKNIFTSTDCINSQIVRIERSLQNAYGVNYNQYYHVTGEGAASLRKQQQRDLNHNNGGN